MEIENEKDKEKDIVTKNENQNDNPSNKMDEENIRDTKIMDQEGSLQKEKNSEKNNLSLFLFYSFFVFEFLIHFFS